MDRDAGTAPPSDTAARTIPPTLPPPSGPRESKAHTHPRRAASPHAPHHAPTDSETTETTHPRPACTQKHTTFPAPHDTSCEPAPWDPASGYRCAQTPPPTSPA